MLLNLLLDLFNNNNLFTMFKVILLKDLFNLLYPPTINNSDNNNE